MEDAERRALQDQIREGVKLTPDPTTGGHIKSTSAEGHVFSAGGSPESPVETFQKGIRVTEQAAAQQIVRDFAAWLKKYDGKIVIGQGYNQVKFDLEVAAYCSRLGADEIY